MKKRWYIIRVGLICGLEAVSKRVNMYFYLISTFMFEWRHIVPARKKKLSSVLPTIQHSSAQFVISIVIVEEYGGD